MDPSESEQIVRQAMELTGSPGPELFQDDSPALADAGDGAIYLVGLIGGKEVGKSALVNALAGQQITEETSHGPGTEMAIAYVHRTRQAEAQALLQREVPGQFRVVPHDVQRLGAQVLVDLPDIDSRFTDHLQITRRMLRHMLFPIWVQSVEKYADIQPQNLLAKVAAGNDPGNFLFCLNKADQLSPQQSAELREDYARRIARVLSLPAPPRVFMISARRPEAFDLPELSRLLSRERSPDALADSRKLASRQRTRTLLKWLDKQDLPGRAARLARLEDEAGDLLNARVGGPLVESVVPKMLDDPAYRRVMTDGVFLRRVARWPIVNIIHTLLLPLRFVIRENAAPNSFFGGEEALVDAHLKIAAAPVASAVQSAFAQLNQSHPAIPALYSTRKLWEPMDAQASEARLRRELIDTLRGQREMVLERLTGRAGVIAPIFRVLVTVGALLWFPFIQPVLQILLTGKTVFGTARDVGILAVEVLSADSLLKNAVFLIIWYLLIWSLLRWSTRRRVDRLLKSWQSGKSDDSLNITTRVLNWIDNLLEPIHRARELTEDLAHRAKAMETDLDGNRRDAA
jgi:GTPase Era involved in 16S rRNA processing